MGSDSFRTRPFRPSFLLVKASTVVGESRFRPALGQSGRDQLRPQDGQQKKKKRWRESPPEGVGGPRRVGAGTLGSPNFAFFFLWGLPVATVQGHGPPKVRVP